jgi:hypothetical protein
MVTQTQTDYRGDLAHSRGSQGSAAVLVAVGDAGIGERRVHAADRLSARLRASQLDCDIRRGASPEATLALALRARTLVGAPVRNDVLRGVTRLLTLASRGTHVPKVPVCRRRVRAESASLQAVCDRLAAPGPVSPHGMAQLIFLLSDGSGPLYQPRSTEDLGARLRRALAALDCLTPDETD